MPLVITDGTPEEEIYEPPPQAPKQVAVTSAFDEAAFAHALALALRSAMAGMPAPVVNLPKPEVKINSPVYVTAPEVRIPATTVNVPEGKAPVVHVESPNVTLQTNRPNKWKFTVHRDELSRITTIDAEAQS